MLLILLSFRLQSDIKMIENLMKERSEDAATKRDALTLLERGMTQQEKVFRNVNFFLII